MTNHVQRVCKSTILLLLAISGVALTAGAQQPAGRRPSLSVLVGLSPYDLSGVGTGFAAGAWADYPLTSFLLAEGGVGYFRYTSQGGVRVAYVLPEVGVRAGIPLKSAFPFLGVGAGFATAASGGSSTDFTLHALVGLRLWLSARVGLRAEARLRAVDPWAANMTDITGGLSIKL